MRTPGRIATPANLLTARSWRVTTAVRVFALALATGQIFNADTLESVGVVLVAIALMAGVCCAIELREVGRPSPWAPVLEAVLATALLGTTHAPVGPLLVYLAIPPIVAGIRLGWVPTANTSLASGVTLLAGWAGAKALGQGTLISTSLPWLLIGMGVGMLAAWQTRSIRALEVAQTPYAAAHRLVGQLRSLADELPMRLDSVSVAESIDRLVRGASGAERSAMLVCPAGGSLEPLVTHGPVGPADDRLARDCIGQDRSAQQDGATALPLRVGDRVFGAMVLNGGTRTSWTTNELEAVQALLDEQAIRLDTALLFDDVRSFATTEERNRLARDIHDGVAQEIVSLGYLADDIAATSSDPAVLKNLDVLRAEITRVISELRFSIFDLRHDVGEAGSLSGALAEYVREVGTRSNLRVHLLFDERGPRLPRRTEGELLRIAQEAIGNVRKHACAINLWATLTTDHEGGLRLVIEDDGIGSAVPREGHYGLHTMRERAARINAELTVRPRPDGGTIVRLESQVRPAGATKGARAHDAPRPARR